MKILPAWMRTLGAAGATSNAAAACERRRLEVEVVDARLQAFHETEQIRLEAAGPATRPNGTTRAA